MQEPKVRIPSPREVVVDVLATTLYEMLAAGWEPRPGAARHQQRTAAEPPPRAPISEDVKRRRPAR